MIEDGLTAYLLEDDAVSALLAERLYALALPENPAYPCATLEVKTDVSDYTSDGPSGYVEVHVEIECFGLSYSDARGLAEAISDCIENLGGSTLPDADQTYVWSGRSVGCADLLDSTARNFSRVRNYIVAYQS